MSFQVVIARAPDPDETLQLVRWWSTSSPPSPEKVAAYKQLDQLVYELYGLTDNEIRIGEGATRGKGA